MLIGGHWVQSDPPRTIAVENPANKSLAGRVYAASGADVDRAALSAREAFPAWRAMPGFERGGLLLRIAADIEQHVEDIARTISTETGNALRTQARPEAQEAVRIFRYFGGLATELKGETLPLGDRLLSYNLREPLGVVGAIIPWNTPVELAALKIAPALCAGNTIVLKAAEDAPLAVLKLAEICARHLPSGVLNVLTGSGEEAGAAIAAHPLIRMVSFTGSTEVGRLIMRAAAERIAPVALELGGKNPSIVFPDADEDWVARGVVTSMRFTRQSQSCTAGSRVFVHESIFNSFMAKVATEASKLRIGDPLDEESDIGTLINASQFAKVCDYIKDGLADPNARLLAGGLPSPSDKTPDGYFASPTIFSYPHNAWRLAREEIFGPVLVAIPWRDEAEVIAMANDTHYGLAAFVWTRELKTALHVAHSLEAGWVQVNQGGGQILGQSYGGIKQSGMGRECSLEGMLDSFTVRKNVTVNLAY